MPTRPILLDTNSFLRLVGHIDPLLDTQFSYNDSDYICSIHEEVLDEFKNSSRLQKKFSQIPITHHEFKHKVKLKASQKPIVANRYSFFEDAKTELFLNCSPIDIRCLIIAQLLEHIVVTDDDDMGKLANEFDIPCITTVRLLHLMVLAKHVEYDKVTSIFDAWRTNQDTTRQLIKDAKAKFGLDL